MRFFCEDITLDSLKIHLSFSDQKLKFSALDLFIVPCLNLQIKGTNKTSRLEAAAKVIRNFIADAKKQLRQLRAPPQASEGVTASISDICAWTIQPLPYTRWIRGRF